MADKSRKSSKTIAEMWQRRVMYAAFGVAIFSTLLFLIAVCTDYWVTVTFAVSEHRINDERGDFYKTGHYHGLWRICRQEYVNTSDTEMPHDRLYCRTMYFFEQPVNITFGIYDYDIMHFRRSSAAMSLVALVLAITANCFTWYSMSQLRYMFKRLAAGLHLITGACCWITVEVFKRSMDYERAHLLNIVPKNSSIDFGFSYAFGWVSMILFILVCIAVFACSRKRKGDRAYSVHEARENEPVVLGRV